MNKKVSDKILYTAICAVSFITIAILFWIVGYVTMKGLPNINWGFLTSEYRGDSTGIFPMMITTIYIIALSLALSAPIGIFSAIYLVEYSKPGKVVNIIKFSIETLAGIPSIIYGLFGYMFFVIALGFKMSLLSGALTLSIMVLPTIIRTTEEALKSVPKSYREGSLALGATKLTTIIKIVLPSAIPGILASVILSMGRIVGETAAVYFTAGMATRIPKIMESGRTLSVHLYMLAHEGISFEQAFATATVLLIIIATLNFVAGKIASNIKRLTTGA
ncbi:phosphate ABC transporter permease PstA [Herbivorax sp. ANBcel31]|uniref:phosphate ABC transporter permease PstA n=1 Tax=Herbivorax sp. ANBcel31 TaxID=3069754 RepID=UPI0027B58BA1|nr:phosphate ABC transporter permease PstA [Herbivorax sp. ANBcel31]MDQ2086734.1 phosphate ABC transporter permease PstA [Herbivorax sp. ANBcel31]